MDLDDLRLLINNWGTDKTLYDVGPYACGDGKVAIEDLKVFIAEWERRTRRRNRRRRDLPDTHPHFREGRRITGSPAPSYGYLRRLPQDTCQEMPHDWIYNLWTGLSSSRDQPRARLRAKHMHLGFV